MSTPDPHDLATPASGVPDIGFISQMANALFQSLPGVMSPPLGTGAALPSAPIAGLMPPPVTSTALSPQSVHSPALSSPLQDLPSGGGASMPSVPGSIVAPNRSDVAGEAPNLIAAPPAAPVSASAAQVPLAGTTPQVIPASYAQHDPAPSQVSSAQAPAHGRTQTASNPDGYNFSSLGSAFALPAYSLPHGLDTSLVRAPDTPSFGGLADGADALYFLEHPQPPATTPQGMTTPSRSDDFAYRPENLVLKPDVAPFPAQSGRPLDPLGVKQDFPILKTQVHGRPIVWLDNGATTQKPKAVIDRLSYFYEHENSNVHRGAHTLAARATDAYEAAREKVRRFLGAGSTKEIIFVRGATEGINLIAQSWGRKNVKAGDEVVVSWLEHHANIVPWQMLCAEVGATLKVAPVDDRGQIILEDYEKLLTPRTRIVAMTQVSNALGTVAPVAEMVAIAHAHGICTLVDGAQAVSHMPVNVQAIGCDFYVLSGHKMFGPTGIGVVYGRKHVLDAMPPWQGGGNMIADVTFEKTVYQPAPERFEAGTGNIADAVGLGAAIDYLDTIGMPAIAAYEHHLLDYGTQGLLTVPGLRIIGNAAEKAGVLSFVLEGQRTQDMGAKLDREGIAVRSGHHCAQPILRRFGLEATVRASLAFYNTCEDLDALVSALHKIQSGRA